jgi:hypothetical protein
MALVMNLTCLVRTLNVNVGDDILSTIFDVEMFGDDFRHGL